MNQVWAFNLSQVYTITTETIAKPQIAQIQGGKHCFESVHSLSNKTNR